MNAISSPPRRPNESTRSAQKPPSGSTGAASQPRATSCSSATIQGLPAKALTPW